ncbi:MAG TPA: MMPL family transporter [Solirubrobacterales bacterium]
MRGFATWCTGHRKTVILSWLAALVGIGALAGSVGADFSEEFRLPRSDSQEAFDLLEHRFPAQSGDTATIVFKADEGAESPQVKRRMQHAFAEVEKFPHVSEVASPYAGGGAGAISSDGRIAYATVQFDLPNDKLDSSEIKQVMSRAREAENDQIQVELGGQPIEEARSEEEGGSSFAIGLLAAIVVLLITFGSLVAMGLPIVTALFALGVALSLVTLGTHFFPTADFTLELAAMIGLGVGIDYALFILTRFRNGLDEDLTPRDAAIAAVDTAGRAVLFAGVTVIIALMGMLLLGLSFLYGVAMGTAFAVLMTMIAALTLLPALLTIAGTRVDRLRIPGLGQRTRSTAEDTRWFRWSRAIQRRPLIAALLSGALLLALCIPTLSLRLGSNDAGTDPPGTTTRKAYDLLAEGFGPGFNGPLAIVAALPGHDQDRALKELRSTLDGEGGVAHTTPVMLNPAGDTGVFQVYPTTSPESEETTELLDHIRDDVIPPVEQRTGAQVHVGGITAIFEDFGTAISEKLPLFIGVVVLLSALLLMTVFRSVLVPLKAIVMNTLSVSATFGLIVLVFQHGWGGRLIGLDGPTEAIYVIVPVLVFAVVFGLSMDYEVFLLTRIKEAFDRSGKNDQATMEGLSATASVITSAALIMILVFGVFAFARVLAMKFLGFGLAVAVLLDATLIRMVLVPAFMHLAGEWNWWPGIRPSQLQSITPSTVAEPTGVAPPWNR